MSKEGKREENRRIATEAALALFLEKGVDTVTTKDIAKKSGFTERSIYRYFDSRADLVLSTTFIFWERIKKNVELLISEENYHDLKGIDQIRIMLDYYSSLFVQSPESVRFILGAELMFSKSTVKISMKDRPPGPFESDTPLANAIRTGLLDGTVSKNVDVEELYYLTYDSILGIMQRQVLGAVTEKELDDVKKRMNHLCEMCIAALEGRI